MLRRKVCVTNRHPDVGVSHQFRNRAEVNPAITSLLAKVCRLQRQEWSLILASVRALDGASGITNRGHRRSNDNTGRVLGTRFPSASLSRHDVYD